MRGSVMKQPGAQEPRWPAAVAMLAVGGLRLALPAELAVGPNWLLLVLVGVLVGPALWATWTGRHQVSRVLGYVINAVVTLDMMYSLALLVRALPKHTESAVALMESATALWVTNILVFAVWYWRLDAGGPHARELRETHTTGAFLFPQMAIDPELKKELVAEDWRPGFIDYLFLAFNTSTAFSPTDAPVLSRWAKCLMMTQASISFATVALLAARAVNVL